MSYRCSRARRNFETQLDSALKEIRPLHQAARAHGGGPRLLGVYYVFVFAQFEVYVKSIIEDSLDALNTTGPRFDQWPDLMLGYLLHKSENLGGEYRRFSFIEDEGALLEKVALAAKKVAAWSAGIQPLTGADAAAFLDRKSYPSPKNLPQLFKRLGVRSVWAMIGRAGKFNAELTLSSLNDLRTGIAHEGVVPPAFSLRDLKNRLEQMRRFVGALDRGFSAHFCSCMISRKGWNEAMT